MIALKELLSVIPQPSLRIQDQFRIAVGRGLDLADLEYISSAGLRVLLTAQKIMSRKDGMEIRNPNELVMEVFDVTGFTDILDIRE